MILVGTDFSAASLAALYEARRLARLDQAAILVLHIFDPLEGETGAFTTRQLVWAAEAALTPRSIIVRPGVPWLEITREARSHDAALIVLGRHGSSGTHPMNLGSTAARVGVAAPCPVVLVPSAIEKSPSLRPTTRGLSSDPVAADHHLPGDP